MTIKKLSLLLIPVFVFFGLTAQKSDADDPQFIQVSQFELPKGKSHFIEDNKGRMVIAVKGKRGLIGLINDQNMEPLFRGYIADAEKGPDGAIWYVGKRQVGSVDYLKSVKSDLTSLFFEEEGARKFSYSGNRLIFRDRMGSIWINGAPCRAAAGMKSLDNPVSESTDVKFPLPQTTDVFGNLWSLVPAVDNGNIAAGVLPAKVSDNWIIMDRSKGFPEGNWDQIIANAEGIIWVSGHSGLYFFDPRKTEAGWKRFPLKENLQSENVSVLTLSESGRTLIALNNAGIFEVDINASDSATIIAVSKKGLPSSQITALYCDRAGRIWVVADNKIFRQDKEPSDWRSLTSLPYGNHDLSGVVYKNKIYTAGGGAHHGFPVKTDSFDRLMIYDIENDYWELSAPMSINRRYCEVGLLDEKIWVIGGFYYSKQENEPRKGWDDKPVNSVEIYDPETGKWSAGPPLDVPRAETVACTMAGRLYVFGSTGKETIFNTLSIGPGENEWRIEPPAPVQIWQTDGCAVNDKAFIVIGRSTGMIMYDPATMSWHTDLPEIPGSRAPRSTNAGAYKGKVWVISGHSTSNEKEVLIYSPEDKTWSEGPSYPFQSSWTFGIEADGKLFIPGGAAMVRNRENYLYWDQFKVLKNWDLTPVK